MSEDTKYLEPDKDCSDTEYQDKFVTVVTTTERIRVCTHCRLKKNYYRLNQSTFMTHLREEHEEKLKQILVARCPDCGMQFNKARTAEHHMMRNHKQNHTVNELNKLIKQMKQNADPANHINWEDKFWTTELREAECFASIGKTVRDCFTCSISAHQNKSEFKKTLQNDLLYVTPTLKK